MVVLIAVMVLIAVSVIMIPRAIEPIVPTPPTIQEGADTAAQIPIAFGVAAFLALVTMLAVKSRRASSSLHF